MIKSARSSSPPPPSRLSPKRRSGILSPSPIWNTPDAPAVPRRQNYTPRSPFSPGPAKAAYDVTSPRPYRYHQPGTPETGLLPPVPIHTPVLATPPRPARRRYDSPLPRSPVSEAPTPKAEKRDSMQRRLSALRGLVANIDFNQPWSLPELQPAQDHGWPEPKREVQQVAQAGYSMSRASSQIVPPTPETSWRSTLSTDRIYTRLDPKEARRQEIMWEMCETEQAFLKSMRNVLRLFATPLKTPQGNWIEGIPPNISDLFDALESVAHVHGVIAAAQRDMRRKAEVVDVGTFVAALKAWVPKLEVYEWYLMRFEPVVAAVEEHVRDEESVFGEFVRMQLKDDALGSMSLGSMLLKPVQRLMKYPLFLKRLLDATKCHPELLSLLASTESIIQRLQAAKAKEEDFQQLEAIEARMVGLPEGFRLAQRGRKLVGHGVVVRSVLPTSIRSSVSSSCSSTWDFSTPSRTSSFSMSSVSSGPSRNGSLRMSPKSPKLYRSPSNTSITDFAQPRRRDLHLLVFDDVVILAHAQEKGGLFSTRSKKERGWRVLPEYEGGIGRVGDVREYGNAFALTVVPHGYSPVTVCLTPSKGKAVMNINSPTFLSMSQFLSALNEATAPAEASERGGEEVLDVFDDVQDDQHPLHSLRALGYAQ